MRRRNEKSRRATGEWLHVLWVSVVDYIGREVTVPVAGSRSRRRGYVSEIDPGGQLIVSFYPLTGDPHTHEVAYLEPDRVRLLKAGVLSGWRAVDVQKQDGTPYLSLRFRPYVIETLEREAEHRAVSLSVAFNQILAEQIERLSA